VSALRRKALEFTLEIRVWSTCLMSYIRYDSNRHFQDIRRRFIYHTTHGRRSYLCC
jgi:hypothetical protein